jgi:hypothetical protein
MQLSSAVGRRLMPSELSINMTVSGDNGNTYRVLCRDLTLLRPRVTLQAEVTLEVWEAGSAYASEFTRVA